MFHVLCPHPQIIDYDLLLNFVLAVSSSVLEYTILNIHRNEQALNYYVFSGPHLQRQ